MRDKGKILLTLSELREFDGKSGKPAYVAFKGKIYDVSESPLWKEGKHQGRHSAGTDLSEAIANAPHAEEVLMKFPVVGEVKQEEPSRRTIADWIEGFHPHPMIVHFPIAYCIMIPILAFIYISVHISFFEIASHYLLIGAFVTAAVGGFSGVFSWKITYEGRMTRTFIRKAIYSVLLAVLVTTCFVWRTADPDILAAETPLSYFYLALLVILVPIVGIVGHYGGKIVYS
jgi:predicted heme/steroid binding protein/uncharacterized membrane protein